MDDQKSLALQSNLDKQKKISSQGLGEAFSLASDAPKFVDKVVLETIGLSASDLLLEPREEWVVVRTRIDGSLYELGKISLDSYPQVTSRFKVLCSLNPTERRKIQEGQYSVKDYDGAVVNLRVEITQTIHGELIVIRVHKGQTIVMNIDELGFSKVAFENFQNMLKARTGLILACGPTGCGKTTTLYSTIVKLNEDQEYNVMTIEDPVEFQLDGVNQMQVQKDIGFTFADGLKTILRLSPDIVMVGEIRDKDTAEIAVESGLTGQLVLSTLHAEDSIGALFRLLDLGIESYLLNSALSGIIAQRLIRKLCASCAVDYTAGLNEVDLFQKIVGRPPKQLKKQVGCEQCKNIGFRGRMGIFEVMVMNSKVRGMIRDKVSETELRDRLVKEGFVTLLKDGLEKAEAGLTTIQEVLRNSLRFH